MLPFYLGAYIVYKNTKPALNPFTKLIPFLIIFVCYFVFRLKFASLKSSMLDKIIGLDINFFEYTATYTKLLVKYFKNIFTLNDIVLIWMTDVFKSSLLFWNTIFLFLVSFSVFIFYKLLKNFAWAFALSILIIGFLPISLGCLFRANEGLMIEPHWLFFPSIGLFTFLAMLLLKLSLKMHQITFCLLMIGLLTTNITSSRIYNYLWKNEIRYCIYWQSIVPQYRWISFHIANSYQKQKNNTLAEYYYLKAITNQISDFQIYTNLGLIKLSEGNELKAVNYFDKALFINPYSSEALNNLALVYIQHQDLSKAKKLLLKAVEINSYQLETNLNLAGIYIKEGAWSEAENLYLKNLENDPRDFETKYNLIKLYLRFQKNPRMVDLANDILKHDTSAEQLTQIGTLFAYYKIPNLPRVFYNQALHVNPRYLEAYLEMGKLLGNENKFDEALTLWTKGLSLNPNDDRLIKLIKEAKRIQNLTK